MEIYECNYVVIVCLVFHTWWVDTIIFCHLENNFAFYVRCSVCGVLFQFDAWVHLRMFAEQNVYMYIESNITHVDLYIVVTNVS